MLRFFSLAYWTVIVLTAPLLFAMAVLIWLLTLPFDRRKVVLRGVRPVSTVQVGNPVLFFPEALCQSTGWCCASM